VWLVDFGAMLLLINCSWLFTEAAVDPLFEFSHFALFQKNQQQLQFVVFLLYHNQAAQIKTQQ